MSAPYSTVPINSSGERHRTHEAAIYNSISNMNHIIGPGTIINDTRITNHVYRNVQNDSYAIQDQIAGILKRRHVPRAVYSAQIEQGCMRDTRVQVLRDISTWIRDLGGPQIFWLAGMAGTGKSAIAWSVCDQASQEPAVILGGSFFCSRSTGLAAQRDVRCVVPTLAQIFARQSALFSQALAAELALDPDVLHQHVRVQVYKLLYKPLLALKDSRIPIVFVIDALDECGGQLTANGALDDAETHRVVSDMLEALVTFSRSGIKLPVKFLVTSRPETHIRETHVSDVTFSKILRLHTVDKEQVTADIRLYISRKLFSTPKLRTAFTENDVSVLVSFCDGLFIVAATAIQHTFGAGADLAMTRFKMLLDVSRNRLGIGVTAPLEQIYTLILDAAVSLDSGETDMLLNLRRLLAALLSARLTLSVAALSNLLDVSRSQLRASVSGLHAVIHVPDDDDDASLRTLHASFGDYLFGRASSHVRISESLGHDALAHGCLHVMATCLHFNVSQSRSSFEPNSLTRPASVTLSLEYACVNWIYHISGLLESSKSDPNASSIFRSRFRSWILGEQHHPYQSGLDEKINNIFRPRLLFWLEVMSVLAQVQRAAAMLVFATKTVQSKELGRFLRDANSFVASSQEAIERSAPHIYISALPLADKESLVYQEFAPLYKGLINVDMSQIAHHAGRLVVTLTGHERAVNSISYSADGRYLASASTDGTVRIWDMRTGEEKMGPLRSGDSAVWSIAFGPCGQSVASGTEGHVICIWSIAAAQVTPRKLRGHSGAVSSVAFSPNGSCLASSSTDKTVRLWSTQKNHQLAVLRGHTGKVHALDFSPDSTTLVTGSEDRLILPWDVRKCGPTDQVPQPHNSSIYSVCFFPDGQRMAAASGQEIILFKAQTPSKIATLHHCSDAVLCVRPSPDGHHLAAVYGKNVLLSTLPRLTAKTASVTFDGHTDRVRCVEFSPDGLYLASASDDRTIRIWSAGGKLHGLPPEIPLGADLCPTKEISSSIMRDCNKLHGHSDNVNSVAVSRDGAVIVSGSSDCTVRVWNARTGAAMLPPLSGHTQWVHSVAISSDGLLIASGSRDMSVRVWDLKTGKEIGQPILGHDALVSAVVFSPDAKRLASGSYDMTVRIWHVSTQLQSAPGPFHCNDEVETVAFSPDYRYVAAGDKSGSIHLWDVSTGGLLRRIILNVETVFSVGFSPDGAHMVLGVSGEAAAARVWNVSSGEQALILEGHTDSVFSATYSSDGRFICTGSRDESVRLWDAATGALIATLCGHTDRVFSVAFTPNGTSIVSSSRDQTIRIWRLVDTPWTDPVGNSNLIALLDSAILVNGWLQGPSGELLLWVPAECRQYIYRLRDCPSRISVSVRSGGWHRGELWTLCRRTTSSVFGLTSM